MAEARQQPGCDINTSRRMFQYGLGSVFLVITGVALLFSLRWAGVALIVFLVAIGVAYHLARRSSSSAVGAVLFFAVTWLGMMVAGVIWRVSAPLGESAKRERCALNLERIAAALSTYSEWHGAPTPPHLCDSQGRPAHSWRVLLLPYICEETVHRQYNFTQPWNAPANQKLRGQIPGFYCCPADQQSRSLGTTSYLALVQRGGVKGARIIGLVELADSGIEWTEPKDFSISEMKALLAKTENPSHHQGGFHVLLPNGTVGWIVPRRFSEELFSETPVWDAVAQDH